MRNLIYFGIRGIIILVIFSLFVISFGCKKKVVDPNEGKIKPNSLVQIEVVTNYFHREVSPGVKLNINCNLIVDNLTTNKRIFNVPSCNLNDTVVHKQLAGLLFNTTNYDQYKVYSEATFIYSKKDFVPVSGLYHNLKTDIYDQITDYKSISLSKVNDSTFVSRCEFIFN